MSRHREAGERVYARSRAAIGLDPEESLHGKVTRVPPTEGGELRDLARLLLAGAVPHEELDEVLAGLTSAADNTVETMAVALMQSGEEAAVRALRTAMAQVYLIGLFSEEGA
jgi:hypothetical protein